MSFVVPALEPDLLGRYHFGACKIPMNVSDPGGGAASGIVFLRGAVSAEPTFSPAPDSHGLLHLFTLPNGMRPVDERWLTCLLTSYIVMRDAKPILCVVRPSGQVLVKASRIGYDGAVFFDGLSFFAEKATRTRSKGSRIAARGPRTARRR